MLIWSNSNETAAGFGMTGEHKLQSSATAKMKFPWKWHFFWKRFFFWKCPRGERDFVSLQPVALGLGVERWAKWSLSKGSSIPVSFHKLLQRIWGAQERKDVPWVQEYKYTEMGQWMLVTALAVRYLSGHREQSCFVQCCSSTSSSHNLFSPKIYSRKNMQSFLVLKWIWECFAGVCAADLIIHCT